MNQTKPNNQILNDEKINTNKHLFNDSNFEKIKQLQQEIQEATDVYPSLRKVINLFINDETIEQIKRQLLNQLR